MEDLTKALEDARARRLETMKACHQKPGDPAAIDADNAAQQVVHELELKISQAAEAKALRLVKP
jgi:hypothetical protein